MKRTRQKLTALLTAGIMLTSAMPLTAAAYSYTVFTNGTFAVLRVADGYTLVEGIDVSMGNDATGYLFPSEELNACLPEDSAPLERGDVIRIPEDSAIGSAPLGKDYPNTVDGYTLSSVRLIGNDSLKKKAGHAEKIGSVFDDPQYAYYCFEERDTVQLHHMDKDGTEYTSEIGLICFTNANHPWMEHGGGIVPALAAEESIWAEFEAGDWVYMLTYNNVPVFPQESPKGDFAAVIAEQDGQYLLSDLHTVPQSAVKDSEGKEKQLQYGDVIRYQADEAVYFGKADYYWQGTKDLMVTENADGTLQLKDEAGNVCEYNYTDPRSIGEFAQAECVHPADFKAGEIWKFAFFRGEPKLPLEKVADEAEEVKPEHVLIIEKVTPTECIVQPHSIKQSFGIIRSEAYMDTPFTLRTESIVACLGSYPERGDILQQNGVGCMVTELAFAVNDGSLVTTEGNYKKGMLLRLGNVLETPVTKDFTVTVGIGEEFQQVWELEDNGKQHIYLNLKGTAPKNVKTGDTVTFVMYYDQPVMPMPVSEPFDSKTILIVEAIGEKDCLVRTPGGLGAEWDRTELTACLGRAPRLGDVLEIIPDGHFLFRNRAAEAGEFALYEVTPEPGLVTFEQNILDSGTTKECRVYSTYTPEESSTVYFDTDGAAYRSYDMTAYTETACIPADGIGENDVLIFAAYGDTPVFPISVREYLKGDTNNSGEVDIMDVIAANKTQLGQKTLSSAAIRATDFNGSGDVDSSDCLELLKTALQQ